MVEGESVSAAILFLAINAFLSFWLHANPPVLMLMLLALAVGGAAVALLMVVMRGLLVKASRLASELSEVI